MRLKLAIQAIFLADKFYNSSNINPFEVVQPSKVLFLILVTL